MKIVVLAGGLSPERNVSLSTGTMVTEALRAGIAAFARQLKGFDLPDAVLTGVETRSSSPLRLPRGEDLQSLSVRGLYPVGEGAGYAGGILSAAADGVRCALAVLQGE